MKTFSLFVLTSLFSAFAFAQQVTVSVKGNKNTQVIIDGRTYTSYQNGSNDIVINDLSAGQHSLQVYRANGNGRRNNEMYNSNFYVNANRDLHITVNGNGRVQLSETSRNAAYGNRNRRYDRDGDYNNGNNNNGTYNNGGYNNGYGYRTAMSDADFNTIFQSVRSKWLPGSKLSAARDVFNNSSYYFSTSQAGQIIGLLSNESNRVELTELAFDNIADQQNFRQLYSLFSSQSSKDQVDAYIRNTYGYRY